MDDALELCQPFLKGEEIKSDDTVVTLGLALLLAGVV